MKYILDFDREKCVGCGACAVACMDQNDIDLKAGDEAFRMITHLEEPGKEGTHFMDFSMACMHCGNAPCIKGCPTGCLRKDPETGFTVYDPGICIGCHSCAMACPFGAPRFGKDGRLKKCDGCAERVRHGMQPACVRVCPFDALKLYREDEYAGANLDTSTHRIVTMILAGQ